MSKEFTGTAEEAMVEIKKGEKTHFVDVDFRGVDLSQLDLSKSHFSGCLMDDTTKLPEDFSRLHITVPKNGTIEDIFLYLAIVALEHMELLDIAPAIFGISEGEWKPYLNREVLSPTKEMVSINEDIYMFWLTLRNDWGSLWDEDSPILLKKMKLDGREYKTILEEDGHKGLKNLLNYHLYREVYS